MNMMRMRGPRNASNALSAIRIATGELRREAVAEQAKALGRGKRAALLLELRPHELRPPRHGTIGHAAKLGLVRSLGFAAPLEQPVDQQVEQPVENRADHRRPEAAHREAWDEQCDQAEQRDVDDQQEEP